MGDLGNVLPFKSDGYTTVFSTKQICRLSNAEAYLSFKMCVALAPSSVEKYLATLANRKYFF